MNVKTTFRKVFSVYKYAKHFIPKHITKSLNSLKQMIL